jgi:AP endonuclease 1
MSMSSKRVATARTKTRVQYAESSDSSSSLSELEDLSENEDLIKTIPSNKHSQANGKQNPTSSSSSVKPKRPAKARKQSADATVLPTRAAEVKTDTNRATAELERDASDPLTVEARGVKRKRKTQAEKEAEAMPLAARTTGLKMYVGAHTSIAKGVENAITNAVHIGGNSFACFLKSQRKWDNPSLQDTNRDAFRKHLITHKYDATNHIVPHGSYLVNLATEDSDLAAKSYNAFLDDLRRCESLGIKHYNFHPGAAGKAPIKEAIGRLASNLNRALAETKVVIPLLENMAARGSIIGGQFADLQAVIALIKPEFKSRIGVCIDTCHAFASGYDLRTPEAFRATLDEFDRTVGMSYLKALHLNDSKAPFGSHRDLHQNIGLGFLGLRAFHNVMNEPRFEGLPLILETPCDRPDPKDPTGKKTIDDKNVWAAEIKLLESLIGMDPDSEQYTKLEKDLSKQGHTDRVKHQKQYDEKLQKENKKLQKEKEKGQKSVKDMFVKPGKAGKKPQLATSSDSELSDLSE